MSRIIIVGSGITGLFCAHELLNSRGNDVVLIDAGRKSKDRNNVDIHGVGGAGGFFDGKQHYSQVLSHTKSSHLVETVQYLECLEQVEKIFTKFGAPEFFYPQDEKLAADLIADAQRNGITLHYRRIRHLGSQISRLVTQKMEAYLEASGVNFITQTKVDDLYFNKNRLKGVILDNGNTILGDAVVLAPGRSGAPWLQQLSKKYNIKIEHQPIEIGGRVEFPAHVLKKHADVFYDPIFVIKTPTYKDTVRTFCCCPNGQVVLEPHSDYITVNGASNSNYNSLNSNFAFVVEISPEHIGQNTTQFAISLAQYIASVYNGFPILQRLDDFFQGKTTKNLKGTWLQPSLDRVVFGDISSILPYRIVVAIQEGLMRLEKVLPDVCHPDNLLYVPEIKLRASRIEVDDNWETTVKGLYVGGDGAGLSGSITSAAVNGVLLSRKINH